MPGSHYLFDVGCGLSKPRATACKSINLYILFWNLRDYRIGMNILGWYNMKDALTLQGHFENGSHEKMLKNQK